MALKIVAQNEGVQDSDNDRRGKDLSVKLVVTKIAPQIKRNDRYSVYINEKYAFSLHEYQLVAARLRVGQELTVDEVENFANESQFGKAYERALMYVMLRPHSEKEIKDYLTRTFLYPKPKSFIGKDGARHVKKQTVDIPTTQRMIGRVMERLQDKGYINDESFAHAWVSSRRQTKSLSTRKLKQELLTKGIADNIIANVLQNSEETEKTNLKMLIEKKRRLHRYKDTTKLTQYLLRQGFHYDDIQGAIRED